MHYRTPLRCLHRSQSPSEFGRKLEFFFHRIPTREGEKEGKEGERREKEKRKRREREGKKGRKRKKKRYGWNRPREMPLVKL
jgi:hypothetical protein